MKKTYKKKQINVVTLGLFIVCLCVVFLTVGFSAFQASLDISDISAIIRVQKDIRITGVTATNVTNNAVSNYEDYNVNSISSSINLPNSDSTVTYDVKIINIGNVEMGILNITGLPSNLNYSINNYTLKDTLCDDTNGTQCKLGSISTLSITIGYANNGYNSNNTNYQINLDFDFERIFTITYNGFSDVSGLPTTILAGDTKTITFTNTTGIPYAVQVNNATVSYSSPTLTLSNATDNITINRYYQIIYVLNGGTNDADNPDKFLSSDNITLNEPSYTDYIFDGWYETSDFSGNVITSTSGKSGNLVLYAKWKSNAPQLTPITSLVAGDHIIYTDANGVDRECVILYDSNSGYGIQVITLATVEQFEIGNGSGSVTAAYNSGTAGNQKFNTAVASYNNARQNLNTAARSYLNSDLSPANGARVVGSPPNNPDVENDQLTSTQYTYINNYNIKKEDTYHTTDVNQMTSLSILNISAAYWLGSLENGNVGNRSTLVGNRYVTASGSTTYMRHLSLNTTTSMSTSKSYTYGLRPVFTLKNTLFVEDNDNGTYSLIVGNS